MENTKPTGLQRFASLVWYEAFIEFVFRFVAKTSELLLALGLVFSAADVLSNGRLMENNPTLLYIWAWFQGVGIEASGGIVLVYGLNSVKQHDKIKDTAVSDEKIVGLYEIQKVSLDPVDIVSKRELISAKNLVTILSQMSSH